MRLLWRLIKTSVDKNKAAQIEKKLRQGNVNASYTAESPLRVLIGGILSQRTRDVNSEKALSQLFSQAHTIYGILALDQKELENLIKCSGFYRQKAAFIRGTCKAIVELHKGKVPSTRSELMSLPGVGPKTADLVLSYGFMKPAIAVDVHIYRVARRIGYTPIVASHEQVKSAIEACHPQKSLQFMDAALLSLGKNICKNSKPKCEECPIKDECDYVEISED